jgi:hypothetical protein
MYTCADIVQQNQQDAFSAMFLCLGREILALCGTRAGEGVIREAVRRAGRRDGQRQLERLRELGAPTDLHGLFHCGRPRVEDPRTRKKVLFDEKDRQIWEVYTCPMASFWNRFGEGRLGSFFCEEYEYAKVLAYTEGAGQLNLSKNLTCPRDNFCRFSAYFREANTPPERAAEAFPPSGAPQEETPAAGFGEGIRDLTISVCCRLLETAGERCGSEGVCAVTEGLKKWAAQAVEALRTQAGHTLRPLDEVFVRENFPLQAEEPVWEENSQAWELVNTYVLSAIRAGLD